MSGMVENDFKNLDFLQTILPENLHIVLCQMYVNDRVVNKICSTYNNFFLNLVRP